MNSTIKEYAPVLPILVSTFVTGQLVGSRVWAFIENHEPTVDYPFVRKVLYRVAFACFLSLPLFGKSARRLIVPLTIFISANTLRREKEEIKPISPLEKVHESQIGLLAALTASLACLYFTRHVWYPK